MASSEPGRHAGQEGIRITFVALKKARSSEKTSVRHHRKLKLRAWLMMLLLYFSPIDKFINTYFYLVMLCLEKYSNKEK